MLRIIAGGCLLTVVALACVGCGKSGSEAGAEVRATDRVAQQSVNPEGSARTNDRSPSDQGKSGGKPKQQTPAQAAGFTGKYEEPYEVSAFTCVNWTYKQMTKAFDLPPTADPLKVAEGYGEGFDGPRFELAAQEGCLAALEGR